MQLQMQYASPFDGWFLVCWHKWFSPHHKPIRKSYVVDIHTTTTPNQVEQNSRTHTHTHEYSVRTQITLMIVSCHRIIHMFIQRIQHHVWSFVHVVLCTIRTRIEWDPLCCRCCRWIRFVQLNIRGHCVLCAVSIVQPLHT